MKYVHQGEVDRFFIWHPYIAEMVCQFLCPELLFPDVLTGYFCLFVFFFLRVLQDGQERGWRGGGGPREEAQGATGEANEPRERGGQRTDGQCGDRQQPQVTQTHISSDYLQPPTPFPNEGNSISVSFSPIFSVPILRGPALHLYCFINLI